MSQWLHKWVSDHTSDRWLSGDGSRNVEWEASCDWALRALKIVPHYVAHAWEVGRKNWSLTIFKRSSPVGWFIEAVSIFIRIFVAKSCVGINDNGFDHCSRSNRDRWGILSRHCVLLHFTNALLFASLAKSGAVKIDALQSMVRSQAHKEQRIPASRLSFLIKHKEQIE